MLTHKRKQDKLPDVQLAVVITPMLDMTFQLLFFLVITFKPSQAMEGSLEFQLPASGERRAQRLEDVDPNKPSDADLALPAQITVVVKTNGDGAVSALIIKTENGETGAANLQDLEEKLKKKREDGQVTNMDDIKIEVDSKVRYTFVIEVMDACVRSKFHRVGFAPPPDLTTSN
jgi:biopolymer transport protein ExbD